MGYFLRGMEESGKEGSVGVFFAGCGVLYVVPYTLF